MMPKDTNTDGRSNRVAAARAALVAEMEADEAVNGVLASLAALDDDKMERVLSRLVALLQGQSVSGGTVFVSGPVKVGETFTATRVAESFADLPASVQPGAKALKRLSGLPEAAVAERVVGWIGSRGEEAVAAAFTAMGQERPPHEISFIESYLGLE